MFTAQHKIKKPRGEEPTDFEQQVAQELFNVQVRRRGLGLRTDHPEMMVLRWFSLSFFARK